MDAPQIFPDLPFCKVRLNPSVFDNFEIQFRKCNLIKIEQFASYVSIDIDIFMKFWHVDRNYYWEMDNSRERPLERPETSLFLFPSLKPMIYHYTVMKMRKHTLRYVRRLLCPYLLRITQYRSYDRRSNKATRGPRMAPSCSDEKNELFRLSHRGDTAGTNAMQIELDTVDFIYT